MSVNHSDNSKEVADLIREQIKEAKKNLKAQLFKALTIVEARVVQNIRKDAGLQVRSGKLLNSIAGSKRVYEDEGILVGELGPKGVPYARIHEEGGVITPVKAKALTIPTEENRRRDGLPKVPANQLTDSFVAKGMIFQKLGIGKNAKITPMFILKQSVTIPARPYLAPALAATREQILKDFGIFLNMAFKSKDSD